MYSVDFIERMKWIEDNLDSDGMLFYDVDSHEYQTMKSCLDTCSFEEDIDYILGYLKENYQKKKGLYKIRWCGVVLGIAVGFENMRDFLKKLKKIIRSMEESTYNDYEFDIKKEKDKLFTMKFYGADESEIAAQERWIAHLEKRLNNFWKQLEDNFKDKTLLNIKRVR